MNAFDHIDIASRDELLLMRDAITKALKKFPKVKEVKKKQPSPDQELRTKIFTLCKDWFLKIPAFTDFYFDGKQAGGLSELIKKMLYRFRRRNPDREPEPEEVFRSFQIFFANVLKIPFYADKVDFGLINSHFEMILQKIQTIITNERKSDTVQSARELAASRRRPQ
jgi:hypothetical protein